MSEHYLYNPGDFETCKSYLLTVCARAAEADREKDYAKMSKSFWLKPNNALMRSVAVYYRIDGLDEAAGALVWLHCSPDKLYSVQFNPAHHAIQTACLDPEVAKALERFAVAICRWHVLLQQQTIFNYIIPEPIED